MAYAEPVITKGRSGNSAAAASSISSSRRGTHSYSDLAAWSVRIAGGLVTAGVRPGEHVALLMANYAEFAAVAFGIARAGAVCVPGHRRTSRTP